MASNRTKNFTQRGFSQNFLALMKEAEKNQLCFKDFLTGIYTEDTDTVTFSGDGSRCNPLTAIAAGGGGGVGPIVFFQVGDGDPFTPAQGDVTYTNSTLPDNIGWVEQRSVGTLVSDNTKPYADITISGKSFTFISGYEFSDGDIFMIHLV